MPRTSSTSVTQNRRDDPSPSDSTRKKPSARSTPMIGPPSSEPSLSRPAPRMRSTTSPLTGGFAHWNLEDYEKLLDTIKQLKKGVTKAFKTGILSTTDPKHFISRLFSPQDSPPNVSVAAGSIDGVAYTDVLSQALITPSLVDLLISFSSSTFFATTNFSTHDLNDAFKPRTTTTISLSHNSARYYHTPFNFSSAATPPTPPTLSPEDALFPEDSPPTSPLDDSLFTPSPEDSLGTHLPGNGISTSRQGHTENETQVDASAPTWDSNNFH
mmetsp:Transcript_33404/g.93747  ORF Transcript_33404/g.93747 Transcript_33404/m.93747 type:complete len:270 (-) Transcript_33404:1196-2005(-)